MDEPCSSLDPMSTGRIEDLMEDLKQDYTIVIVTHNMQQAARISDRTAFFTAEAGPAPATVPGCWSSSTTPTRSSPSRPTGEQRLMSLVGSARRS